MSFFSSVWVNIVEEDRWRLILESWNSRELLDVLLKGVKDNWCELKLNSEVIWINPLPNPPPKGEGIEQNWKNAASSLPWGEIERGIYEITTISWTKYKTKNVIISSWWKSFFQVWTTWDWYNFASDLWIKVIPPYRSLCWMSTKRDLSEVSWISCNLDIKLIDKKITHPWIPSLHTKGRRLHIVYEEKWPFLFTHFWVSGPIIFNVSNAIWEYLNSLNLEEKDFENYILNNLSLDLNFDLENTPKRVIKFFELDKNFPPHWGGCPIGQGELINLELQNWRSWKEAKATGGGVDINELDNNLQSKKYKWLYFIWEVVDITWKTWGYNLQWGWSSAFVAWKNIKK
jgi:hypothetical protein